MKTSLMLRRTGVGWGGVGMMTFLAHEDIFDATENWGGLGRGGDDDVPCT